MITRILLLVIASCLSMSAAVPDYKAFRGAGGITVTSNPPNGTIVIDGTGISAGALPDYAITNEQSGVTFTNKAELRQEGNSFLLADVWATNGPVEIGQTGFPITFGSLGNGWLMTNNYAIWQNSTWTMNVPGNRMFLIDGSFDVQTNAVVIFNANTRLELDYLTADRVMITGGGSMATNHPTVTTTEIGYVDGVTSAIQTQLDGKQATDTELTEWSGISTNKVAFTNSPHITERILVLGETRPISLFAYMTNPYPLLLNGGTAYVNNRMAPETDGFNTNYVIELYELGADEHYIIMTNHVHFEAFQNGIQNANYRGFAGVTMTNYTASDFTLSFSNTWVCLGINPGVVPAGKAARVNFHYDSGNSGIPRYSVQVQDVHAAIDTTGSATLTGTNRWLSGYRGNAFTNTFTYHLNNGVTNGLIENIRDGQTITWYVFLDPGVTLGLPQFPAAKHVGGSVISATSNVWTKIQFSRHGVATNVLVTSGEFALAPGGNLSMPTNFATGVITINTATDLATEDLTITNAIAFVNQTLAGVGGANTNFTGLPTHGEVYINGGLTNVNFVAFMPGTAGLTYYLTYNITNLTADNRNISMSSVTNRIQNLQQYHGIAPPYVLTNKHSGILSVKLNSTNAQVSFIQHTNGF